MSIFDSIGQSDIWSISGIHFGSPIKDIMDKQSFNLEELLREEELLQEVKSKNDQLIDFLSLDETIEKLVDYIIQPPEEEEESDDLRSYKYPYMSCEVFCCEVAEIIHALVENQEGKHLKKLFSILDSDQPLDNHLAGYFEKILEMLFRRMTISVMSFLNTNGTPLFLRFLHHIDNYSITQIVQRLMLPHIPFSNIADFDGISSEERSQYQCVWSFSNDTFSHLCSRMLTLENSNIPFHISDLLITVLQLSPPDTVILTHLCDPKCFDMLLVSAFSNFTELTSVVDETNVKHSVSLASISVLESLVSRLCESVIPYDEAVNVLHLEENATVLQHIKENIDKVSTSMLTYLSQLAPQLRYYVDSFPCGMIKTQTKNSFPRLGHRCLQLVKLVESLIRISESSIDNILCETGVLKSVIELFFKFELNSLLHLSVQRIVLMILDSGETRRSVQNHILVECSLLTKTMDALTESSAANVDRKQLAGSRRPILGHLIQISQAILATILSESTTKKNNDIEDSFEASFSTEGLDNIKKEEDIEDRKDDSKYDETKPTDSDSDFKDADAKESEEVKDKKDDELQQEKKSYEEVFETLKSMFESKKLYNTWEVFVTETLNPITDVQTSFLSTKNQDEDDLHQDAISHLEASMSAIDLQRHLQRHDDDDDDEDDDDDDDDDDDEEHEQQSSQHNNHAWSNQADFADFGSASNNEQQKSVVEITNSFADFDNFSFPTEAALLVNENSSDDNTDINYVADPFANTSNNDPFDPFSNSSSLNDLDNESLSNESTEEVKVSTNEDNNVIESIDESNDITSYKVDEEKSSVKSYADAVIDAKE